MKRVGYLVLPAIFGLSGAGVHQTASAAQQAPSPPITGRGEILWQYETGG
jgi:hypothetical protein